VQAQRDRLKEKVESVEMERDGLKQELAKEVRGAEQLRGDNVKLYEKVRYLSSALSNGYGEVGSGTVARSEVDLEALETRYEKKVDPFKQFANDERRRAVNKMGPIETVVFVVAKMALGNKEARSVLFFYVLGLHLLCFLTTYHWSHEMGCHDFEVHPDLLNHPQITHMQGGLPEIEPHLLPGRGGD